MVSWQSHDLNGQHRELISMADLYVAGEWLAGQHVLELEGELANLPIE